MIKSFSDLEIYRLSYKLAIDVFNISKTFPKSEKYSLTDQIVRSISTNIAEGFGSTSPMKSLRLSILQRMKLEQRFTSCILVGNKQANL